MCLSGLSKQNLTSSGPSRLVLLVGGPKGQSRAWQPLLKLPPISTNGLVHYNYNAPHSQPIAIHLLKLAVISTTSSFWLNFRTNNYRYFTTSDSHDKYDTNLKKLAKLGDAIAISNLRLKLSLSLSLTGPLTNPLTGVGARRCYRI